MKRARVFVIIGVAMGLILIGGLFAAYRGLTRLVEAEIRSALGPGTTIRSLDITWRGAGVTDLRVPAPADARVPHMLKAERIWVTLSFGSLVTETLSIASIEINQAYLLIQRTPRGLLLPLPVEQGGTTSARRKIEIQRIEIPDAVIDWDDTTVRPPVRLRLAPLRVTLARIHLPASGPINLAIEGEVTGRPPGQLQITGWTHPQSRDSDLRVRLTGVDLVPLQPYFLGPRDAQLTAGRFDLTMQSRITGQKLRAPGQLALSDLRFAPGEAFLRTFIGVPRDAILKFLETNGRLEVQFVVEGPLDSPQFRLQEAMTRRIAVELAEKLGVPIREIAKELIEMGVKGADAVKKEGEAVGKALRGIFK